MNGTSLFESDIETANRTSGYLHNAKNVKLHWPQNDMSIVCHVQKSIRQTLVTQVPCQ